MPAIWSEYAPWEQVMAPATLELLRTRGIRVIVAVPPSHDSDAAELVARCREGGVEIGLWPLLDDRDGRWASAWNAPLFAERVRRLRDRVAADGAVPDEFAIDLEPPIRWVRAAVRGLPRVTDRPRGDSGAIVRLVHELRESAAVTAAAVPLAAVGLGDRGWQRILGAPLAECAFDRVSVMAYTSLVEGYSRGLFRRGDATSFLDYWAREVRRRFGDRGGLSLGCVGVGALGDEATYRTPAELAEDAAIARAGGVEEVTLFGLGGVLGRPPHEEWLDAMCEHGQSPPAIPPMAKRVRATIRAFDWFGQIAARWPENR